MTPTTAAPTPAYEFSARFETAVERSGLTSDSLAAVRAVGVTDLDGDGALDLIAVCGAARSVVIGWGPLGTGWFETTELSLAADGPWVGWLDADRDGDLDLLVPAAVEPFAVLVQTAPRTFGPGARVPGIGGGVADVAIADLDGDGRQDVAVARAGPNQLLLGDGVGGFVDASSRLPSDARTSIAAAAGGLLGGGTGADLVFGGPDGLAVLANSGLSFADVTQATLGGGGPQAFDLAIEDFDGDGDSDLAVRSLDAVQYLRNDGAGGMQAASTLAIAGSGRMQVFDEDGDGDLDLAVGSTGGVFVYSYDASAGTGGFSAMPRTSVGTPSGVAPDVGAWLDLDADGAPDLVVSDPLRLLWGIGTSQTYQSVPSTPLWPAYDAVPDPQGLRSSRLAAADFDLDGDIDAFGGSSTFNGLTLGFNTSLYRNDGAASFAATSSIAALPSAAADLNLDGAPDLVHGTWVPGDGSGGFLQGSRFLPAGYMIGAMGDFDGDGEVEVLGANASSLQLFDTTSSGPTLAVGDPLPLAFVRDFVVGDFDRDGRDDVLCLPQMRLFGGGEPEGFGDRTAALPPQFPPILDAAFGDWDGDGRTDLIVAHVVTAGAVDFATVYLQDATGSFVAGPVLASSSPTPDALAGIAAVDIDEDGRAEVLIEVLLDRNTSDTRVEVFEAVDASGVVRQVGADDTGLVGLARLAIAGIESRGPGGVGFYDIDGDGDLDLLAAETRINTLRDLKLPPRSRYGEALPIRVVDRTFVAGETALIFVTPVPAQEQVPGIGRVLVDPTNAIVLTVDVAAAGGAVETAVPLPAVALPAMRVYAQAVLLDANGAARGLTSRAFTTAR